MSSEKYVRDAGSFAEVFFTAGPGERARMVEELIADAGVLGLRLRGRSIAAELKKRGVPFSVLYDFELNLARQLHPDRVRHRGAEFFLDPYYRERARPYLREIRELEAEGLPPATELVPVLAEIDVDDGPVMVRMFLDRELSPRSPDSAVLLRALEDGVGRARRSGDPRSFLIKYFQALAEENPEAGNLFRQRVQCDRDLRRYAKDLVLSGGSASPSRPDGTAERSAPDPRGLYTWALKHTKQFEETFANEEDAAALERRIGGIFRKLNQERGRAAAVGVLDRMIEGADAARLLDTTRAILTKIKGIAPPVSAIPAAPAEGTRESPVEEQFQEQPEGDREVPTPEAPTDGPQFVSFDEFVSSGETGSRPLSDPVAARERPDLPANEPSRADTGPEFLEEEPVPVAMLAASPSGIPPATEIAEGAGEPDGFPARVSEKEQFLAEKRAELAELEAELRRELNQTLAETNRIAATTPDPAKAAAAIRALGDPRFAPYRERILAELEEADDLFRRIMGLLSELSRRLTIQELRVFVDGLIAELRENETVTRDHPHLIERLTNYRNSLLDDPPELLRTVHLRLDEIRRSRSDYIGDQLAYLKGVLENESYRRLWPTIFNIYQNILQQKLDLTLSGIAERPAPEQIEMFRALQQGFAPGSPVHRELEARLRGAELAGVADRLERERNGEIPELAAVRAVAGGPAALDTIQNEIQNFDPEAARATRERGRLLNAPDAEPVAKERALAELRDSPDTRMRGEYIMHRLGDQGGTAAQRLKLLDGLAGMVDPAALDAKRGAIREEAALAGAQARLVRALKEKDPARRGILESAAASDPHIPDRLRDALGARSGGQGGALFDAALLAITGASHPPAIKLNFLKSLANIAKTRGWLDPARSSRIRMAIDKYAKIAGEYDVQSRANRARHHFYFARGPEIVASLKARGPDAVLSAEDEHSQRYAQARQVIDLAAGLGVTEPASLPPFLRAAIPEGFDAQVETVLKQSPAGPRRPAIDPAADPLEAEFRAEIERLPFPAPKIALQKLYAKFSDPRRRKILGSLNALSRPENRPLPGDSAPSKGGGQDRNQRQPLSVDPGPSVVPDQLDAMINTALQDSDAVAMLDVGGPPSSLAATDRPGLSSGEPLAELELTPTVRATREEQRAPEPFVGDAPVFEPAASRSAPRGKGKSQGHLETRAPSWDEKIAGSLSKLGGTLRETMASVKKKSEPREKPDDDFKKLPVSKLAAKATGQFFDFSKKKKAEDIFANLVPQEELIARIKSLPEFKQAQQDPRKVDQIAESVKTAIAVTVMPPKDVRPIGFPETVCFPRKDWFDDLKRKKLIKAAKEMAKKNTPGNERFNYYMWLAEEIEMRYYQSKYKRGKLD